MKTDEASNQWELAAPGWAKWEDVISSAVVSATNMMFDMAGVVKGKHAKQQYGPGRNQCDQQFREGSDLFAERGPACLDVFELGLGALGNGGASLLPRPHSRGEVDDLDAGDQSLGFPQHNLWITVGTVAHQPEHGADFTLTQNQS